MCLAVWMATGAKDAAGGDQQTWTKYASDMVPVYMGSISGEAVFDAGTYHVVFSRKVAAEEDTIPAGEEQLQEIKA